MVADRRVHWKKETFGMVTNNKSGVRSEKKQIKPGHKRQLSLKPKRNAVAWFFGQQSSEAIALLAQALNTIPIDQSMLVLCSMLV